MQKTRVLLCALLGAVAGLIGVSEFAPAALGDVSTATAKCVYGGDPPPGSCSWHAESFSAACNLTAPNSCRRTGPFVLTCSGYCGFACSAMSSLGPAPPNNHWGLAYFSQTQTWCGLAYMPECVPTYDIPSGEYLCECIPDGGYWIQCTPEPVTLDPNCGGG